MRTTLALVLALSACSSISSGSAWSGVLEAHGTMREVLRDGRTEARVALVDVARPGVFGVGALEGLRGEVTVADGEVWVSEGDASGARTTRGVLDAAATMLFTAEVAEWREVVVPEDVDPSVLDEFVAAQAKLAGLDVTRPFPFVVAGELAHLRMHVIAGECPIRARMLGREPDPAPYELELPSVAGRLVGVFAPDHAGVVCHHGSKVHAHVLLERDGGLTGHVETVGVAQGAVLSLPAR